MRRGAGILMHIASLPGRFGIGTFGKEAYEFVDFIKKSGFKYWQILPLGHTGFGDSPYQCFNAFAGNPYFIDFNIINQQGLLQYEDFSNEQYGANEERIDYGVIYNSKYKVLRKAYENFKTCNIATIKDEFEKFKKDNKWWIEDYSLYMALKLHLNVGSWYNWPEDIKFKKQEAVEKYKSQLSDEINYWSFIQYEFFSQWKKLKNYANERGISIIGDIPIYVAADSADTWSNPENFLVDEKTLEPKVVAGCPPDAFSEDGQLWGNLIYDWDKMKKDKYKWWVSRIKQSLKIYDVVRIDHFRGFESYWAIPFGDETARNGKWEKGPAMDLFDEIKNELGEVNIIAEDLGFLTDEVREFLKDSGFPGMRVLQFAFDGSGSNNYLPHNYERKCIAYTGTHDNDTFMGWFKKTGGRNDVENAKSYLGLNEAEGYNWGFIRGVLSSIADIAVVPMQDLLALGNDSRMNMPSSLGGNWSWRMKKGQLVDSLADKVFKMNYRYGRI